MVEIVEGFRKVVQELLVPELKAVQTEIKYQGEKTAELQQEMKELRKETNELRKEMNQRFEAVQKEMVDLKMGQNDLKIGQREILNKLDVDKRITKLETLVEQILKKAA